MAPFETRRIGHTALSVTTLGLGSATLGNQRAGVTVEEAKAIVHAAWAAGVRYIDTAPYYGVGKAERCVGDAHARPSRAMTGYCRRRSGACCARASGPPDPATIRCRSSRSSTTPMTRSCARSKTACSASDWRGSTSFTCTTSARCSMAARCIPELMRTLRDSGYRALESLRGSGVVQAIGIGVNEREVLLEALEWGDWDAFLLAGRYTLLEQQPIDGSTAEMRRDGHLDRGRRAAELRHPRRPRHLELCSSTARDRRARQCDPGGLRQSRRAARRGGIAISARPSGGRRDHPGPAQRRRIRGQPGAVAPPYPGRPVGGPLPSRIASSGRADSRHRTTQLPR